MRLVAIAQRLIHKPAAMKIAILSDIHALAGPYKSALSAARAEGFDLLVIMGDLLTYGVQPEQTLDLTQDAIDRDGAKLLLGNHDAVYRDGPLRCAGYLAQLPKWVRESFEWTRERAGSAPLWQSEAWLSEYSVKDLLLSHANPFGEGNWTYLNGPEPFERACRALATRGYSCGVFGHVHRFRRFVHDETGTTAVTIGSIGQPREPQGGSQWAMVELTPHGVCIEQRRVTVDWREEAAAVMASSLSEPTKQRIVGYFI